MCLTRPCCSYLLMAQLSPPSPHLSATPCPTLSCPFAAVWQLMAQPPGEDPTGCRVVCVSGVVLLHVHGFVSYKQSYTFSHVKHGWQLMQTGASLMQSASRLLPLDDATGCCRELNLLTQQNYVNGLNMRSLAVKIFLYKSAAWHA